MATRRGRAVAALVENELDRLQLLPDTCRAALDQEIPAIIAKLEKSILAVI